MRLGKVEEIGPVRYSLLIQNYAARGSGQLLPRPFRAFTSNDTLDHPKSEAKAKGRPYRTPLNVEDTE